MYNNNNNKIIKSFLFLVFVCVLLTTNTKDVNAISEYEFKTHLLDEYRGFFTKNGEFKSLKTGKNINLSTFSENKDFYYGNSNDVKGNTKIHGIYTSIGLTSYEDSFPNRKTPYSVCTTGDIKNRNYILKPFKNKASINNSKYKPKHEEFNNPLLLQKYFIASNKYYSLQKTKDVKREWLENLNDPYAEDDEYDLKQSYFKSLGCFTRSDNNNQWDSISATKKDDIIHLIQVPTDYSHGVAIVFHKVYNQKGVYLGDYFDQFYIDPLLGDNFKATTLNVNEVSSNNYEIHFEVTNASNRYVNTNQALTSLITIEIGGHKQSFEISEHGVEWEKGEKKISYFGTIELPPSTPENTKMKVTANFNNNKIFDEKNYLDNIISSEIKTSSYPICTVSGGTENKDYSVRVCDSWVTNHKGNTVCASTVCDKRTINLSHDAKVKYNDSKQTLLGVWSRNTKGHTEMTNVPKAYNADIEKEEYFIEINNHVISELKVDPFRRILRAGRSLEMYSLLEIELSIMSFEGLTDIEARKNNFITHLEDTLKSKGVDLGDGKVTNNNKKDSVKAQLDELRKKKETSTPMATETFGETSCTVIERYTKKYKIFIPIKTKNEGGISTTNQGTFVEDVTYKVQDAISLFYTNINTMNGLHALEFEADVDGSKIGQGVNQVFCKSTPERFGIQGNIYDDIRTIDVNDEDDDWDF